MAAAAVLGPSGTRPDAPKLKVDASFIKLITTDAEWEREVNEANDKVLCIVDVFCATWGPCEMVAGHFSNMFFDLAAPTHDEVAAALVVSKVPMAYTPSPPDPPLSRARCTFLCSVRALYFWVTCLTIFKIHFGCLHVKAMKIISWKGHRRQNEGSSRRDRLE